MNANDLAFAATKLAARGPHTPEVWDAVVSRADTIGPKLQVKHLSALLGSVRAFNPSSLDVFVKRVTHRYLPNTSTRDADPTHIARILTSIAHLGHYSSEVCDERLAYVFSKCSELKLGDLSRLCESLNGIHMEHVFARTPTAVNALVVSFKAALAAGDLPPYMVVRHARALLSVVNDRVLSVKGVANRKQLVEDLQGVLDALLAALPREDGAREAWVGGVEGLIDVFLMDLPVKFADRESFAESVAECIVSMLGEGESNLSKRDKLVLLRALGEGSSGEKGWSLGPMGQKLRLRLLGELDQAPPRSESPGTDKDDFDIFEVNDVLSSGPKQRPPCHLDGTFQELHDVYLLNRVALGVRARANLLGGMLGAVGGKGREDPLALLELARLVGGDMTKAAVDGVPDLHPDESAQWDALVTDLQSEVINMPDGFYTFTSRYAPEKPGKYFEGQDEEGEAAGAAEYKVRMRDALARVVAVRWEATHGGVPGFREELTSRADVQKALEYEGGTVLRGKKAERHAKNTREGLQTIMTPVRITHI